MMLEQFFHTYTLPAAWLAVLTLIFLEVVLGIDNVVFLSISTSRLPVRQQPRGRVFGLGLAMIARIALLFGVSLLAQMTHPFWSFRTPWFSGGVSWQGMILFGGGVFLLWKSVHEIHRKLEHGADKKPRGVHSSSFWVVIAEVVALDMIFSMDSILTAVGMVSFTDFGYEGAMTIMITAIVAAVAIMLFFATAVSRVVERYPSIQMLALSFLLLVAVLLIMEAAHLSHLSLFDTEVPAIPRGYVYFAIAFSLMVEFFNIRLGRRRKKKGA